MNPPKLTEDEVDELLYLARTGARDDFEELVRAMTAQQQCSIADLLAGVKDEHSGNGVLHMLAANGHTDFLRSLLTQLGSPASTATTSVIGSRNASSNTPLHYAALNGHLECVKLLMDRGADPTTKNAAGHDAVYEAELNDRTEVVEWVLREGGEGLETPVVGDAREGEEDAEEGEDADENVEESKGERREGHGERDQGGRIVDGSADHSNTADKAQDVDPALHSGLRRLDVDDDDRGKDS